MSETSLAPGPEERVFDLIDVVEGEDVMDRQAPLLRKTVYELVDVVVDEMAPSVVEASVAGAAVEVQAPSVKEDTPLMPLQADMDEEIRKQVMAIAESVSRELFPAIAERIIREEIEKLKGGQRPVANH